MQHRVLIVVENLPVPYDQRVWLEAGTLIDAGFMVSVISPTGHKYRLGYEYCEGIHVHRYPMLIEGSGKLGLVLEYAWAFVCISVLSLRIGLLGRGFDVLQVCNPPEIFWPVISLWRLAGKGIVFDHHDLSPELSLAKFGMRPGAVYRLMLLMERLTFRSAHYVISTNESYRSIATARGSVPEDRIAVVRNGPNPSRFAVGDPVPSWRRGRRHMVAFLGEIGEQDGVDGLMRAIRSILFVRKRTDVQFVVMGGGPHFEEIVRLAGELGMAEFVTFTGRVDSDVISAVLSTADAAVDPAPKTPYADASTATKIMEYMFFGVPIVAFDLTETMASADDCALYAHFPDEEEFANCILRLVDDPEFAQDLGRRGYRRVRDRLLWEHSAPRYLETIRKAAGRWPTVRSAQA